MALRHLFANSLRSVVHVEALGYVRASSAAPSVFDTLIEINVIDKLGRRHTLRGREGETLAAVLEQHADTLGEDVIVRSPEGRASIEAHVKVPNELLERVPRPAGDDARFLQEVADVSDLDRHSRLASRMILDQDMQGALVSLGHHAPWNTL